MRLFLWSGFRFILKVLLKAKSYSNRFIVCLCFYFFYRRCKYSKGSSLANMSDMKLPASLQALFGIPSRPWALLSLATYCRYQKVRPWLLSKLPSHSETFERCQRPYLAERITPGWFLTRGWGIWSAEMTGLRIVSSQLSTGAPHGFTSVSG